jgi:polysaccharide pyruvyl transferase WcaK-like protein
LSSADRKWKKVAIFGHFGTTNLGNDSTLSAVLYHLRRFNPDADVTCICSVPEDAASTHHIDAMPITQNFAPDWVPSHRLGKVLRKGLVALPSELYRWTRGLRALRTTDMLIIPGTGLLTDVSGLFGWGPYSLFRWSLTAKISRCKILFVSVGAGPIYGVLGKSLVKRALSLADFRSYRDDSTKRYLESHVGFRSNSDRVYPDLVFSLPDAQIPRGNSSQRNQQRRPVVGVGLMLDPGRLSAPEPTNRIHQAYVENLVSVVGQLVADGCDVRLLIGDRRDASVVHEFMDTARARLSAHIQAHIADEPANSASELLSQIASTDIVVATRFHNVILALLCGKPVIAISFHHKCESLMRTIGLSRYCLDIDGVRADDLIERLRELEANADEVKRQISGRVDTFRHELDEQYEYVFRDLWS